MVHFPQRFTVLLSLCSETVITQRLPNGCLNLLSPECLMAGVSHNVGLRLELVLTLLGDSGNSSQGSNCPYQVARKYLKSPISGKGLLRDFWKKHHDVQVTHADERAEEGAGGEECCCFCLSLGIFPAIKCQLLLPVVLLVNTVASFRKSHLL